VDLLRQKGVNIPNPESVYISENINLERISGQGVTLYAGCKIIGEQSLILPNVTLGYGAPVTLENTMVGANSRLDGGIFQDAVFAGDNTFGTGAHVRKGTILEEQANAAHTVGLKQAILFPFVTLGSLINLCDCFMAGGTSRKDHSEVGSSFVHFNYTPNQDKATASMMGNVYQGVMLNQKPIFLGGQGGIVGPLRLGYGCLTAAGSVIRKNELRNERLILGGGFKEVSLPRRMGVYSNVEIILNNNVLYIAGLISLKAWYHHVRSLFVHDYFSGELLSGMQKNLDDCIDERIKRLKIFHKKLLISRKILSSTRGRQTKAVCLHDTAIVLLEKSEDLFKQEISSDQMTMDGESFVRGVELEIQHSGSDYISVIQNLDPHVAGTGSLWLHSIEEKISSPLMIL